MIGALLIAAVVASPSPAASAAGPVAPAPDVPAIALGGEFVRTGAVLDAAAWRRFPHVTIDAADHAGAIGSYDGLRLADILHDAGVPTGDAVRGRAARSYLVVGAADGYTAIFALAELDPTLERCAPVIADARDGAPLVAPAGPVAVVAPCDRTHARWVRGVTTLTVVATGSAATGAPGL